MMDAGASNGRMSDKRNDQAVSSPKGEWLADTRKLGGEVRPISGAATQPIEIATIKKVLDKGDIECPATPFA